MAASAEAVGDVIITTHLSLQPITLMLALGHPVLCWGLRAARSVQSAGPGAGPSWGSIVWAVGATPGPTRGGTVSALIALFEAAGHLVEGFLRVCLINR